MKPLTGLRATSYRSRMTRATAGLLIVSAAVLAGAAPTGAGSPVASGSAAPYPGGIERECVSRTDTSCVVWPNGHPDAEGPLVVKYIDDGEFCVYRRHAGGGLRCEAYWPFGKPVINADLK